MSGGYAGAKATVKFLSAYAGSESNRNSLKLRFVSVLPQLTPATDLGLVGCRSLRGPFRPNCGRLSRAARPDPHTGPR
jgi:hypothetical protein